MSTLFTRAFLSVWSTSLRVFWLINQDGFLIAGWGFHVRLQSDLPWAFLRWDLLIVFLIKNVLVCDCVTFFIMKQPIEILVFGFLYIRAHLSFAHNRFKYRVVWKNSSCRVLAHVVMDLHSIGPPVSDRWVSCHLRSLPDHLWRSEPVWMRTCWDL